ncbi:MAG: ABC transporter permease [Gemmatimonadota bacterium]
MSGWRRFRGLFGPDPDRDVDEELSFHVDMRMQELIASGETPERARELALKRFGDAADLRAECITIDERHGRRMERSEYTAELKQDVVYALRSLRHRPGFAVVAILTLALGIGANSAIFSVVNGVLLQPLPYAHADRLYNIQMIYPDGQRYNAISAPDFASIVAANRVFEEVVASAGMRSPLIGLGEPREVVGAALGEGLLDMLGLGVALGRGFSAEDHAPGRGNVAILDNGFWQREFGGDASVLGRSFTFAGGTYTVAGVLAPDATLPEPRDVYFPLIEDESFSATAVDGRRSEYLDTFARARAGLTEEQVAADMLRVSEQLAAEFPTTNQRLRMGARSAREAILGDVHRPLFILLGAVGFVLLVACANVANLLLARAAARQGELSVRAALGAGRGRLLRQMLTESVVLGVLGGASGLAVAWAGTRALAAAQPADIPRLDNVGVDGTVVLVTLGTAVLTGLLFGALPALQATRAGLAQSLREGGRGMQAAGQRARSALIVAEMALAVVLLVGAGLLIRSFVELMEVDPGFTAEHAVAFRVSMDAIGYPEGTHVRGFVSPLIERVRSMPGVTAAGGTSVLPLQGRGGLINFAVVGAPPPPENVNAEIGYYGVTPGYFDAIGARIIRGRDISPQDRTDAPPVAVISETGAAFWFPGEDPLGRFVEVGGGNLEIVGIVSDVLQRDLATPAMPQLFGPYDQWTTRSLQIVARTTGDPLVLAPNLRTLLRSLDPNIPLSDFTPLEEVVSEAVARPRFYTSLLALFAALALTLAAIGIFGVMSYSVTQRTREISIRMALGARRGEVVGMIIGRSMLLAAVGVAAGIAGAATLARVISSQLYNVKAMDPATLGTVILVLAATALAASWLPARRAAALDPGTALREN